MRIGPVTYAGVVRPGHCDAMGHMNITWYVSKFDEATWTLFSLLGITRSYMQQNQCAMAAVEQTLHYKRELLAGDTVTVRSQLLEVREKVIRYRHEMVNNESGEVACITEITSVHLDADARKSCPFPPELLARLRKVALETDEPEP